MITKQQLLGCLKGAGIELTLEDGEDININDLLEDSIQFISTLVEIENYFGIEVDDKFLEEDIFSSFNYVLRIINEIKGN